MKKSVAHYLDQMSNLVAFLTLLIFATLVTSPANANGQPPVGFRRAMSTYIGTGMGNPWRVWVKVTDRPAEKVIKIWIPPSRQDAITNVYRGSCLMPGCIFLLDSKGLKTEYRRMKLKSYSADGFTLGDWAYTYE